MSNSKTSDAYKNTSLVLKLFIVAVFTNIFLNLYCGIESKTEQGYTVQSEVCGVWAFLSKNKEPLSYSLYFNFLLGANGGDSPASILGIVAESDLKLNLLKKSIFNFYSLLLKDFFTVTLSARAPPQSI